jgi:hypothetical protein
MLNTYHFRLSSVKRDSGLLNNERISQDIKYLERSLEELAEKNVIWGFDKEVRRTGRNNQIADVLYTLKASMDFIKEMKTANVRHVDIQRKLETIARIPGRFHPALASCKACRWRDESLVSPTAFN